MICPSTLDLPRSYRLRVDVILWCNLSFTTKVVVALFGLLLCAPSFADSLESKIKACNWDYYDTNIRKFEERRKRLPPEITVSVKSCASNGPTYRIKTDERIVIVQDGWREGEQSTTHLFSIKQPSPQYWEFRYQGYEWGGYLWIHRKTGRKTVSPGNQCKEMNLSPDGKRGIVLCFPEYGGEDRDLYLVDFSGKISFKKLHKNPPQGDIAVDWSTEREVSVSFNWTGSRSVRRYRI